MIPSDSSTIANAGRATADYSMARLNEPLVATDNIDIRKHIEPSRARIGC
jgi:hypothetical protein